MAVNFAMEHNTEDSMNNAIKITCRLAAYRIVEQCFSSERRFGRGCLGFHVETEANLQKQIVTCCIIRML